MSSAEETEQLTALIERLVVDPSFRGEFRRDPIEISQAYGLGELAEEFRAQGNGIHTLELRESKSSLAGVVMAIAAEGIGLAEVRGMLGHGPGHAAALKALKGAGVKTPSGGAAGLAKAAGLHGVPGAGAHGKGVGALVPHAAGAGHAAPGGAAPAASAAPAGAAPAAIPRLPPVLRLPRGAAAAPGAAAWYRGVPPAAAGGTAPNAAGGPAAASPRRQRRALRPPRVPLLLLRRRRRRSAVEAAQPAGGGGASPAAPLGRGATRGPHRRPPPPQGLPQPPRRCPEVAPPPLLPLSCSPARTCRCRPRRARCSRRAALTRGCVSVLSNAVSHHTIVLGDAESVVDPVHAQAVDIVAVDGQPIGPANIAARDLITEIAALDPSVRPNEIGTPWPIESPGFFTDPAQAGRLHLAFVSSADFQPGAGGAGAPAAGVGPAPATPAAAGAAQAAAAPHRLRAGGPRAAAATGRGGPAGGRGRGRSLRPPADDRCRRGWWRVSRSTCLCAINDRQAARERRARISGRSWTSSRRSSATTARRGAASSSATHCRRQDSRFPTRSRRSPRSSTLPAAATARSRKGSSRSARSGPATW